MSTPILGPNPADREEWLAARTKIVSSTEIARIMRGEGWAVYHEKIGDLPGFEGNRATRRGNRFQRPTLEEYAEESVALVYDGLPLLIDPECPALAATPDAVAFAIDPTKEHGGVFTASVTTPTALLLEEGGYGVEAKTSLSPKVSLDLAEGEDGSDYIPESWQWQCQSQCAVTGWEYVDVAILLFGKLKIRRVLRNPTLIDVCRATATEYLDRIARKLEPPFDGSAPANQAGVKSLYKPTAGETIDLSAEAAEIWAKRAAATAAESAAKREKEMFDASLRQKFGDAETGVFADGSTLRLGKVHVDERIQAAYEYTRFWFSKPKTKKGK